MNIVVCVKYVPDATADRTFDSTDNTVDRVGVDGLLSELDEYAIEEALTITESGGGEVTVSAVRPNRYLGTMRLPERDESRVRSATHDDSTAMSIAELPMPTTSTRRPASSVGSR